MRPESFEFEISGELVQGTDIFKVPGIGRELLFIGVYGGLMERNHHPV
jgi:hypothetical protein